MAAYRDQVEFLIKNRMLPNGDYVLPGHSKVKVKRWIPVINHFDFETTWYLFAFSSAGVTLFPMDGHGRVCGQRQILWREMTEFHIRHGLLEDTMTIRLPEETLCMKMTCHVLGSPWVGENRQRLMACQYGKGYAL